MKQAEADLARSSAQYRDSLLVAPVDGVITKVNVKPGQLRPSTEPSITMLGTTPFRIEMFVSEVDVPAVHVGQSGSIVLDAYKKQEIPLVVREIDTSSTEKDGVPKYRVKLDILSSSGVTLRIGMTGDATIITGFRSNVVSVPLRSILDRGSGSIVRILTKDGTVTEKSVSIGMEGEGGNTEVLGIDAGETIIVVEKK